MYRVLAYRLSIFGFAIMSHNMLDGMRAFLLFEYQDCQRINGLSYDV